MVSRKVEKNEDLRQIINRGGKVSITRAADRFIVKAGNTQINVETAKRPGCPWDHKAKEEIEIARASYHVAWGSVPLWDDFDLLDSTFNYIAYVQYPSSDGEKVVEALSNRMVLENPEDLTFYTLNDTPLVSALEELFYRKRGCNPRAIAGESRIGAIRPPKEKSNAKTIEAFAAIKIKMVEDAREMGIDYIACQLRSEMPSTIFSVNGISYEFPRTDTLLGLPVGSVRLNRNNPEVVQHIINFPGYFLDTKGVHKTVQDLCERGELSLLEFERCTGLTSLDELMKPRNIKQLTQLIRLDSLGGAILKARLIKEINDGTFSSISHIDEIEKRAMRVLQGLAKFESSR